MFTMIANARSCVFSRVDTGALRHINGVDGVGMWSDTQQRYIEFDIDVDVPQKNDMALCAISVLYFMGYNYKGVLRDNMGRTGKIDFSSQLFSIPYAVRFADTGRVLVCNAGMVEKYAVRYPEISLGNFIADTMRRFQCQGLQSGQ